MRKITAAQAKAAFQILVEHAGQRDNADDCLSFMHHVSLVSRPTDEYRFQGALGFGGKFRNNGNKNNIPYVDCYRENETPQRLAMIETTNAALRKLFGEAP